MSGRERQILVDGKPTTGRFDDTHVWGAGGLLTGDARTPPAALAEPAAAPPRRLTCACCGAETQGRPWPNRDAGYGVCLPCADANTARRGEGGPADSPLAETTYRLYGRRGVHFALPEGMP